MPPGFQPRGDGPRGGATLKDLRGAATVWRLFRYVFRNYKVRIGVVLLCIVVTSLTSLASSLKRKDETITESIRSYFSISSTVSLASTRSSPSS